jgi:hypothetical protein
MDNTDSPGWAEARGSNSGNRENDKSSTQQIPDSAPAVNRTLIKRAGGFELFEIRRRRNGFSYEIVSGTQRWVFPLLFSAYSKLDRLTRRSSTP